MKQWKGYFAGTDNYETWHAERGPVVRCAYCQQQFTPTAPLNLHCEDCLPAYRHDQWRESLSRNGFIKKCLGLTPAEFIAEWGQEAYDFL